MSFEIKMRSSIFLKNIVMYSALVLFWYCLHFRDGLLAIYVGVFKKVENFF